MLQADFRLAPPKPGHSRGKSFDQHSGQVFFLAQKTLVHITKTPSHITKTFCPAADRFFPAASVFCQAIKKVVEPAIIFSDAANKIFLRSGGFFDLSQAFFDAASNYFHIKKSPKKPVPSPFKPTLKTPQTQH